MHYSILKKSVYAQIACLLSLPSFGDEKILTDAGREVLLKDDGSWTYLSDDRFGTLSDGSRARLKADGSWKIENSETRLITIPVEALKRSKDTITAEGYYLQITKITIESQRGKNRKNSTLRAQTLVDLKLKKADLDFKALNKDLISFSDSRGRLYEIKNLVIHENVSDTEKVLRIFLEGAPRWWGIKFFSLEFQPGFIGQDRKISLNKSSNEITRLEVDALTRY